jgi:hypothetical protein
LNDKCCSIDLNDSEIQASLILTQNYQRRRPTFGLTNQTRAEPELEHDQFPTESKQIEYQMTNRLLILGMYTLILRAAPTRLEMRNGIGKLAHQRMGPGRESVSVIESRAACLGRSASRLRIQRLVQCYI